MASPEISFVEGVVNNWPILASIGVGLLGVLSFKQREAIKKRDHFQCQHPDKSIVHGGRLEIDHILPQRWAYTKLDMSEEEVDSPLNLVTECRNHHRGHPRSRHPDAHIAWSNFHEDRDSFANMEKERDEKIKRGEIYWNDTFDTQLQEQARKNTIKASQGGWVFPKKNKKNGEKSHF